MVALHKTGSVYIHQLLKRAVQAGCIISDKDYVPLKTCLPETLEKGKRRSLSDFFASISSINPLSFLKVYTSGKSNALKRLLLVTTLQSCLEGRCTSDIFQVWARNNMKATAEVIRNLIMYWGAVVTSFGLWGSRAFLPILST